MSGIHLLNSLLIVILLLPICLTHQPIQLTDIPNQDHAIPLEPTTQNNAVRQTIATFREKRQISSNEWAALDELFYSPGNNHNTSFDGYIQDAFQCMRGTVCILQLDSIVGKTLPRIGSHARVTAHEAGLKWEVSRDNKSIVGIAFTHGTLLFVLEYTSIGGKDIKIGFNVKVPDLVLPNHIFHISLKKPEKFKCNESPAPCLKLLKTIAKYLGCNVTELSLDHVKPHRNGATSISFHRNSFSLNVCQKFDIENMQKKMCQENETKVNPAFEKFLTPDYKIDRIGVEFAGVCENFYEITTTTESPTLTKSPVSSCVGVLVLICIVLFVVAKVGAPVFKKLWNRGENEENDMEMGLIGEDRDQNENDDFEQSGH